MRRLFLSLIVFALTLPAFGPTQFAPIVFAQAKHTFTFEDMMKLKRVGDPQVSPDGKWVLFSVVDVNLEANTKTPHIWIVPLTHGAAERVLIPDQDADRPRWAPDGKRFAFLSTKTSGSQIWVADFDSAAGTVTATHRLTVIETEAGGELWSPDGKNILFTSDVYPECDGTPEAEGQCNANKVKAAQNSKVKALIFDHLLYRHWNAYKEGKRSHVFVVGVPEGALCDPEKTPSSGRNTCPLIAYPTDLTPGDYDAPVFSLGGQDNYAFSPDGKEICYVSNHDKNEAASTNNDLWIVPVSGGQAKNITADNPASDSTPLYSPDGRYIAYRAQQRPGYESDRFLLTFYDRTTEKKKDLQMADRLGWVGTFIWSPDSSKVYFVTEIEGESWIWNMELNASTVINATPRKDVIQLVSKGFNDDIALADGGNVLLFTRMSLQRPSEIYKTSLSDLPTKGKTEPVQLTHLNDALLSQVEMSSLESFYFTGAGDDKVQGFLVKPPNFDASKKYPVKFLIHGGPQGAWGDDWSYRWNPELFAAPTSGNQGYVVIMINFHGSTGYGQKFIDAINGDWGGAPYEDLMKGLDYAEQTYPFIDKTRECALGASYGGYMINWILGHTDRFKCLVSHDGMFNAESAWGTTEELWFNNWEFKGTPYNNRAGYEKWSPHQYAKNFKTPTLVIHGQRDYRLDVSEGFQLFTTLQMEGVPSKMLYFPDEGHWVQKPQNSKLWYETVNAWVDQWAK
jgi:dipeptidyl aminopeptidase/acylaminoacyl peptidase